MPVSILVNMAEYPGLPSDALTPGSSYSAPTSIIWFASPSSSIVGGIVSINTFWPIRSVSVRSSVTPRELVIKAVMLALISMLSVGIVTDASIVFRLVLFTFAFKF